jgi:hypothetical protein
LSTLSEITAGRKTVATAAERERPADGLAPTNRWLRPPGALVLLVLGLCMTTFMLLSDAILSGDRASIFRPSRILGGSDSYPIYFALQALRQQADPYGLATTAAAQAAIWWRDSALLHFVYPLPALIWYLPGLWLDLAGFVVYVRLLGLVTTAGVLWATARLAGLPLTGWSVLALTGLLASLPAVQDQYLLGQNASLGLLLGLAIAWLYGRDRYLMAGVLVPLTLVKPHYLLCLVLGLAGHALVERRRWPFLAGAAASGLVVGLGGELASPGWLGSWLDNLRLNVEFYQDPYLAILVSHDRLARGVASLLLAGLVSWLWWRGRAQPLRGPWAALAVTGSLAVGVVAFGTTHSPYNLLPIWPALALALLSPAHRPRGKLGRLALALIEVPVMVLPVLAALIALAGLVGPSEWRPGLIEAFVSVIFGSLWLAPLVLLWLAEQTLPAAIRTWEPGGRR